MFKAPNSLFASTNEIRNAIDEVISLRKRKKKEYNRSVRKSYVLICVFPSRSTLEKHTYDSIIFIKLAKSYLEEFSFT